MNDPRWFGVAGLVLDLAGAIILAAGLIVSRRGAVDLSVARWAAGNDDDDSGQPQVKDRLRQSRNALVGIGFIALGFFLQVIGSWPR